MRSAFASPSCRSRPPACARRSPAMSPRRTPGDGRRSDDPGPTAQARPRPVAREGGGVERIRGRKHERVRKPERAVVGPEPGGAFGDLLVERFDADAHVGSIPPPLVPGLEPGAPERGDRDRRLVLRADPRAAALADSLYNTH